MARLLWLLLALAVLPISAARAAPPPARTLEDATAVLDDLAALPLKGIPPALLADADGVAIIPRVVKAGFVVGGRTGHGVVIGRDKTGAWGDPVFIDLAGASVGFQAGIESADVVLVFRGRTSLDRLLAGKDKLVLGADVAVAAGPIGRQAAAGTDGKLDAEVVSYARARGLFAGVSLDGAGVTADRETTEQFRKDGRSVAPKQAEALKARLNEMSRGSVPPVASPVPPATPSAVLGPPTAAPKRMPEHGPMRPAKDGR
jgi:lipid-binding SYLF domain-containing protein